MAQTMHKVSFGPVFTSVCHRLASNPFRSFCSLLTSKIQLLVVIKYKKNKKKKLTISPNDVLASFGLFFRHHPPSNPFWSFHSILSPKLQSLVVIKYGKTKKKLTKSPNDVSASFGLSFHHHPPSNPIQSFCSVLSPKIQLLVVIKYGKTKKNLL